MAFTRASAPGEPDATFARRALITLFLILAAHSMTETARDALFLSRLPATQLPWMYLLVAVVSIAAARVTGSSASRLGQSTLSVLLLGSSCASCVFWAASWSGSRAFLYLLYVWPAVFSSVVIVEFWRVVSDAYTITEAKRIFGRLGAGGTAGALAGSGLAVALSTSIPTSGLLLVAGLLLTTAIFFAPRPQIAGTEPASRQPAASSSAGFAAVRSNRYLVGVALCLLLATIAATLVDFVFKSVVARHLPVERLANAFAEVSFAVSAATFLLQMTLVGPLIRRLGVTRALIVLPAALSLGAAGLIGGAGLFGALVLRVADGTLRFSLHRTSSDLLYVPLTPRVRVQTKSFIDVLSQRGGQVAGAAVILVGLGIGAGLRFFAVAVVLLGVASVVMAIRLKQAYLDLFRTTLKKEGTETRLAYPRLNVESLASLVAAFSSDDEREVVAAMDLVAELHEVRAIPVVMLFHPSRLVVMRALDLFEQHRRDGFAWALDRLRVEAKDPNVKAAALSAYASQRRDSSALLASLDDESEVVRATALVGLVAGGWLTDMEAEQRLAEVLASSSVIGKESLAMAIRAQPSSLFEQTLVQMGDTFDVRVRARVAEAMERMPSTRFLLALRSMLSDTAVREPARRALVAAGGPGLHFLAVSLDDESLPRPTRMHLPRSISRFPPPDAMPVLWRRLLVEPDDLIRFKILRGLGRLAAEAPEVRPTANAISDAIRRVSRRGLQFADWRLSLKSLGEIHARSDAESLLIQFLADKQERATESIIRLLGLTNPTEDFERVYRGLRGNRTERASGRELLENVVHPPERDAILVLIEDPLDPDRLARLLDRESSTSGPYEETLASIMRASDGALQIIAARRAVEIGLVSMN